MAANGERFDAIALYLEAHPDVRVRIHGRWREARAHIDDDDELEARLDSFQAISKDPLHRRQRMLAGWPSSCARSRQLGQTA